MTATMAVPVVKEGKDIATKIFSLAHPPPGARRNGCDGRYVDVGFDDAALLVSVGLTIAFGAGSTG
jgi:hypothetical protein